MARIIDDDMRQLLHAQRLGFVATVRDDDTPNLSPKGSVRTYDGLYDGDCIVFADIRSPATVWNLRRRPDVEINVVDALSRKGYRFRGRAIVLETGDEFRRAADFLRSEGVMSPFDRVVAVRVTEARPLTSPTYDAGATEAEVRATWRRHWTALWDRTDARAAAGEAGPVQEGPDCRLR